MRTNVGGTAALLDLCRRIGLPRFHLVSTAFVCGRCRGRICEEDLDLGQEFHNPYEQSKFEAERLVRQADGIEPTIYRPAVIVGDSRTGQTSTFTGLYRVLEMAVRLAEPPGPAGGGMGGDHPPPCPPLPGADSTSGCRLRVTSRVTSSRWTGFRGRS